MKYEKARTMIREEVIELIDEKIIPAQKEGRIVFTNGGQWVILEGDNVRIVDITGQMKAERVQSAQSYAHAWGLTMPLHTRPAEPEASNWLAFELDFV